MKGNLSLGTTELMQLGENNPTTQITMEGNLSLGTTEMLANMTTACDDYSCDYTIDFEATPCSMSDIKKHVQIFVPVIYLFVCVFGLIGNSLVIVTYAFYKKSKSMTDVYLVNLAIADLFFVLTLPFNAVYRASQWVFTEIPCKLVRGIYGINFYSSMLMLALISIDRYIAIVQATRSFKMRAATLAYSRYICIAVWIFASMISVPDFVFSSVYMHDLDNRTVCEPKYPMGFGSQLKLLTLGMQITIGFCIPLWIIITCYSFIINTLHQAQNFQRHKAVRVVIAVVLVFLLCQVPYNIILLNEAINFFEDTCSTKKFNTMAYYITQCLAFFHCCLNPVLYAFIGVKFRNYFIKIMQDLWCLSKKYMTVRRSSRMSSEVFSSRRTSEVLDVDNPSSFTM
ncbi:C-C chemokine receptor type 6a [Latimeria chalumnae]|uniref:C-C motif chemokine receptor 6 n=1 Tax=Latimeria chalumnae TaxID=7897 RepID=M3XL23_LATCH|nr:PREDICTED: C-C chemokine receptor type 6 [Latimeria chalumnae]XP_014344854.1 PREDICTED: C-C chemokine receptor type 6 [Latimeria chalumnae]|eukprot:XP_014344853.1 PREDICTED: C-C chemokine receptor type 6 [Latimeria chalumnae]